MSGCLVNPYRYNVKIACDSAKFDGLSYMLRGGALTGVVDGKKGLVSVWVRLDALDGTSLMLIHALGGRFYVERKTNNTIQIEAASSVPATVLSLLTVNTYTNGPAWLHILSSWDLATGGASGLYINDVSDISVPTFINTTIDYAMASPEWAIGAQTTGTSKLNGCLAEVYFNPTTYLDLSVQANRRLFITNDGKPVPLGSDGSVPTGAAPAIYHHLDKGETPANFALNRGAGGNFTITGALTTGSTSPSD